MSLIIALPRERRSGERRVALDPSRVERLLQDGLQVWIETDCGHAASFSDESYQGVTVTDSFADVVRNADIIVKVVCPTLDEIALMPPQSVLVCTMGAFQHLEEVTALQARGITVLGMDRLPRTTRAQPMDAVSSQATVAGYKAALLAAELSPRLFPMLTTAAGTIRPSRVLVIGAGVAGLQAIATSRRLGAQVEAYDIRRAAKEQIESLGARMIDTGVEVEGAGGVARALRKDEKQIQQDVLAKHLARAHVVICAASLPGRRAPRIITEDMVDGMLPESVIVDMAAATGGNCVLTRVGEHYYHNDTLIVGPMNLPSHGAVHASEMYSRNIYNMLQLIIVDQQLVLDPEDEIIASCMLVHDGQICPPNIAALLDVEALPFGGSRRVRSDLPDQATGWLSDEDELVSKDAKPEGADSELSSANDTSEIVGELMEQSMENKSQPSPVGASAVIHVENDEKAVVVGGDTLQGELGLTESQSGEKDLRGLATLENIDADERIHEGAEKHAETDESLSEGELVKDELIRIDGVGPALQGRLYAFGYRQYRDLADLDDAAIEKLSIQLELNDEIQEQDWRGQAQRLAEKQE